MQWLGSNENSGGSLWRVPKKGWVSDDGLIIIVSELRGELLILKL